MEADIKAQIAQGRTWWLVSNIPALYQLEVRPNGAIPGWIFPTPEQQTVMDVLNGFIYITW